MYLGEPLLGQPARARLSPNQNSRIAATYDTASFNTNLPAHTRWAFAKKADWFRLLARVGEMRERRERADPFTFIAAGH
jgi:hypothetical protein